MFKLIAAILAVVVCLPTLAWWNPVVTSRIIWPSIEDRMLEDPFLGVTAGGSL